MQNIAVTLLNLAETADLQQVVVWQDFRDEHQHCFNLAWKVISYCRYGWRHPFTFSGLLLTFEDQWGNHTQQVPIAPGNVLSLALVQNCKCWRTLPSTAPNKIGLRNDLTDKILRANLWRGPRRAAVSHYLVPGESTTFLNPDGRIRIGVVPGIKEGTPLSLEAMARCPTELDFSHVARTTVLMLGAGPGALARPFSFHLTDVVLSDIVSGPGPIW